MFKLIRYSSIFFLSFLSFLFHSFYLISFFLIQYVLQALICPSARSALSFSLLVFMRFGYERWGDF